MIIIEILKLEWIRWYQTCHASLLRKELNIAPKLFLAQGPRPQCEMMTCNNNFQSALNEGWDEDEEPAAETESFNCSYSVLAVNCAHLSFKRKL